MCSEAKGALAAPERSSLDRRQLLTGLAALAGIGASAPAAPSAPLLERDKGQRTRDRRQVAHDLRVRAAEAARRLPTAPALGNGDETEIPDFAACFTKALPHNARGLVDAGAYRQLLVALESGDPLMFEQVPLGGPARLADPQAAFAYDLIGCDASQLGVTPAPRFSSPEQAGELVELYWQALLRDVGFSEYSSHPLVREACEDLSRLSDFRGPKEDAKVTPATLFRGDTAGDLEGPYLSQFLMKPIPYTPMLVEQRMRVAAPGLDYLTGYHEWLAIQNGALADVNRFDSERRFLRTGRDLAIFVHRDFTYQAFLTACLILLKAGTPVDGGNPYKHSRTQGGFSSFGSPFVLALLATATQLALKACWWGKWAVHRRLRPEEMAGRVDDHLTGRAEYPLHAECLEGAAIERLRAQGSFLLPQAYPEGSPIHSSYPSGHAAIAGACATVLKAFFDESYMVPEPVVPAVDGLSLLPWKGAPLSVGDELDKLAANVSIGRNFAGIHWRSDAYAGLRLGEAVAVDLLRERKFLENELFTGFSFRSFDGNRVVI